MANRPSYISRFGVSFDTNQEDDIAAGFAATMQSLVDRPFVSDVSQVYDERIPTPSRSYGSPVQDTRPVFSVPRTLTPYQQAAQVAGAGSVQSLNELQELGDTLSEIYNTAAPRTPEQAYSRSYGAGASQSVSAWMQAAEQGRLNPDTGVIEPNALSAEEVAATQAPEGFVPLRQKDDGTWVYVPSGHDDLGPQIELRAVWGHDAETRAANLAAANPGLAAQALEMGMTIEDLADIDTMVEAQSRANAAMQAIGMGNQSRARQLLTRQSPESSLISMTIFSDQLEQARKAYEENRDSGESILVQFGSVVWNVTAGFLFNLLIAANDVAQQVVRTAVMLPSAMEQVEVGTPGSIGEAIQTAWNVSAPGYLSAPMIDQLRSEYGERETDIMVEAYMARNYGDDSSLDSLFSKYSDDPEALNIIFTALTDVTPEGQRYNELYAEVAGTDQGNTGNLIARSVGLNPNDFGFGAVRDVTNVTSMFIFDPTLLSSKARGTYMGLKYGIHQMAGTSNLTRSFSKTNVRRWFDWFGSEIERVQNISDSAERGRAITTLLAQSRKYANSNTVEIAMKHNLRTADDFYDFLTGMETVERVVVGRTAPIRRTMSPKRGSRQKGSIQIGGRPIVEEVTKVSDNADDIVRLQSSFIESQSAKRFGQIYTPHMSKATEISKGVIRTARGNLDVSGRILARSTPALDNVLGADFATVSREEQLRRLTLAFQDDAAVQTMSRELGDFTGQRTVVGNIVDTVTANREGMRSRLGLDRKGWQRRGVFTDGVVRGSARIMDRWSRLMARLPDQRAPISWVDGRDADRVYQLMRAAGVHRGAASEFRGMWIEMNEAQRRLAYIGLIKMYGRAAGVHLVDPKKGMDNLLEGVTGVRATELHAANQIPRFGALMREVGQEAEEAAAAIAKNRGGTKLTASEMSGLRQDILARRIAEGEFAPFNPSVQDGTLSSAVWIGQTSDYGFFPNIYALDDLTARSSMLNALLFNNKAGLSITDWWVLGTLAGPRFQLRNAVEEIGLYALTGGSFNGFMTGRAISTGLREGAERADRRVVKAKAQVKQAQVRLDEAVKNNATEYQLDRLRRELSDAKNELSRVEAKYGGRGKKLGIAKTTSRKVAESAAKQLERNNRQSAANALRSWWLPYLSKDEVTKASRVLEETGSKSKAREAVAELQVKAVARQFLTMMKDPDARAIVVKLKRGAKREDLSPRQQQILNWVDDLVRSPHGLSLQDQAAETARHFADGTMPAVGDMGDAALIGDDLYDTVTFRAAYESDKISSRVSAKQAEAIFVHLSMAVSDGPRGQALLRDLPRFWYAYNRTPGGPDAAVMDEILTKITKIVDESAESAAYRSRLSVGQTDDPLDVARSPMMDLVGMFTTPDGKFNKALYEAMKTTDDQGRVFFRVVDDVDGEMVSRISLDDFVSGKFDPPANTLVFNVEKYAVPANVSFRDRAWSSMGRSFARMVREPIFGANYLDARQTFLPLQREWARVFGEEKAARLATDAATERAFQLTMAYGDNPAVRSQLAWQVRNVARFYRAIEDFGRRMWRTARNNPMAFWKASLAWNATLDSGWVYEDEYGDAYFVYPGSKAAINVMNDVLNLVGLGTKIPSLDMGVAGKVQWLTPSADPESWLPTLSGPWASFLYRPLLRSLPGMDGLNKELERAIFGSIGANQELSTSFDEVPFLGEVIGAIPSSLPPIINKTALGVFAPLYASEVRGSFASRMTMKAALAMAANGDAPRGDLSRDEQSAYLRRLDATAVTLSIMSIIFGLSAPAAPQVFSDDASKFAREMGFSNVRPALLRFIQQQEEAGVPYEVAVAKWLKDDDNLTRGAFTLSVNQTGEWGFVRSTEGNIKFIQDNEALWRDNPVGMTFFMPNTGASNMQSFTLVKTLGYSSPRLASAYAIDLLTQEGYIRYRVQRAAYEDYLSTPGLTDEEKRLADEAWSATSYQFMNDENFPGLDRRIKGLERSVSSAYRADVAEAINVAEVLAEKNDPRAVAFMGLVPSYRSALEYLGNLDRLSADYSANRSMIKSAWESTVWDYMNMFPDDESWRSLMVFTTKALDDSWSLPVTDPDGNSQ